MCVCVCFHFICVFHFFSFIICSLNCGQTVFTIHNGPLPPPNRSSCGLSQRQLAATVASGATLYLHQGNLSRSVHV